MTGLGTAKWTGKDLQSNYFLPGKCGIMLFFSISVKSRSSSKILLCVIAFGGNSAFSVKYFSRRSGFQGFEWP